MNKTGIFLLVTSLLLHQVYDTSRWKLGQYLKGILFTVFGGVSRVTRAFEDGNHFRKSLGKSKGGKLFYVLVGLGVAVPLFLMVGSLLISADAVFRDVAKRLFEDISFNDVLVIIFMIVGMFFGVYGVLAYTCDRTMKEEVPDKRTAEPIPAITVTGMLTAMYVVFCGIQIIYLFLGKLQLPKGYTYASYAREGFFQLLAVSVLNLIIVLVCMAYFRESKILKAVLIVMSACTFILIASSAVRMIIYIRYYYLTFLRIFVLWSLALLFLLFVGIVISIVKRNFPLFRYSCVAVTCCYLILSYSHPDFWIAKVNTANAAVESRTETEFFRGTAYQDTGYLSTLSIDAAPVLLPWLEENGAGLRESGYYNIYRNRIVRELEKYDSLLQYNISRHVTQGLLESQQ